MAKRLPALKTIPVSQIHWLIDRLHVSRSDLDVAREVWRRTGNRHPSGAIVWPRPQRRLALKVAILRHHQNRALYARVMGGI
jgi:hypothetical protein